MPVTKRPSRIRAAIIAAAAAVAAVAIPMQVAVAAPVSAGGFTTGAVVSADPVAAGTAVTITASVTATTNRAALVDVEVYDTAGHKLAQRFWDNRSFVAGRTRTFRMTWTVPASQPAGTLRVDLGVFSVGWGTLYHWNRGATSVTIATGPVSSTTTTTSTTTPAPATTTTLPSTTTTTTTRPPTTTTTTATTVPAGGRFVTLPPRSALPSDAECAARVRPAAEIRQVNAVQNHTVGHTSPTAAGIYTRVTGNFTGTTDEIIQWAACKWGFDEDVIRAQTAIESWWVQKSAGDLGTDASRCPPGHGIGVDGHPGQCPESWGVQQVRYPYNVWAFNDAITSTAFNLDAALAARRSCFEGYETWLNTVDRGRDYAAGDLWGCVGMWFSGRWYTQPAVDYIARVQDYLRQRIWETGPFISFQG
jgi:autotransporter family porin